MQNVTPEELNKLLHDEDTDEILIDVCTPAEYKGGHISEAKNIPLAQVGEVAGKLKGIGTVYVNCGSGARSKQACDILSEHGVKVVNVEGGLSAWLKEGLEVKKTGRGTIPIIRQVMITAGSLVLLGVILGDFVSPYWYLLSGFIGAGLLFSGISGHCTMSNILSRMPWNR